MGTGTFSSTIRFEDDRDIDVQMSTVSLSGSWLINQSWTVRAALGTILNGELKNDAGTTYDVKPGGLASVGLEYLALNGSGYTPFVHLSAFLGGSWTETSHPANDKKTGYFASDLRLGARAGWNINNKIFPYVAGRVFGGPVNWELDGLDVTGSDIHHYQLALGSALQISKVAVYAEWAALGEQAVSAGLSISL